MTLNEACLRLSEAIFCGSTVREVVELCAQALGTPLRFTIHGQPDGGILSSTYPYEDFLEWKALVAPDGSPSPAYRMFLSNEYAFTHGSQPYLYPVTPPVRRRRLLCMALVGSRRAGHISIPEVDVSLEELDPQLISLCAHFLAVAFFQAGGADELLGDAKSMKVLLSNPRVTYPQVAALATDQVFPRKGRYRLMAVRLINGGEPQQLATLCARLTGWLFSQWCERSRRSAVILFEDRPFNERIMEVLREQLGQLGCSCCLSPLYEDLMQTSLWYQRIFALRPFKQAAAGDIVFLQDYIDFALYAETGLYDKQLRSMVWEPVRRMEAWDESNGTGYIDTLRAYIEQGANQKRAAGALYLHVNTVAYRFQRIREQFGIDLNAPGVLTRVLFSLRLLQYLKR